MTKTRQQADCGQRHDERRKHPSAHTQGREDALPSGTTTLTDTEGSHCPEGLLQLVRHEASVR